MPKTTPAEALPPHALEAERGILGCLMQSPAVAIPDLQEATQNPLGLFYDLRHRRFAEIVLTMHEAGQLVDPITVGDRIRILGAEGELGGSEYWLGHIDATPSAANLPAYLDVVESARTRRNLLDAAVKITAAARESSDAEEALEIAEKAFTAATVNGDRDPDGASSRDVVGDVLSEFEKAAANQGKPVGIPSGLVALDDLIRGFRPGQLVIIGARPSEGKTALAGQIAEHVAVTLRLPVGFWSLEMERKEIVSRMVCSRARVPLTRAEAGTVTDGEVDLISKASVSIAAAPLRIYDRGGISIRTLRVMARRAFRKYGLRMVVVDFAQLVHGDERRKDRRDLEVGEVVQGCKELAKELGLPVILLSQLNRDYDRDRDRDPRLSDLRDSGAIEQAADVAILIAPEIPKDGDIPDKQSVRLLVKKCRNGRQGVAKVNFNRPLMCFQC